MEEFLKESSYQALKYQLKLTVYYIEELLTIPLS